MERTMNMKALFIILNAGFSEEIIALVREAGVMGATIMNARGTGAQHAKFLGITVDTEKELLICITDEDTANKAMMAAKEQMGIKTPAHCICFTMPVDKTVGISGAVPKAEQ